MMSCMLRSNPMALAYELWPHYRLYDRQQEIVRSVRDNRETFVTAGNQLGKDFVAGYIALSNFITAKKFGITCRIITTSVVDKHLSVLWGEIGRFATTSKIGLTQALGGPLIYNHRDIRWEWNGKRDEISYLRGMVCKEPEGMAGHHADWTIAMIDEASGVENPVYDQVRTWAKRLLVFGNPLPTNNFFKQCVKGGDQTMPTQESLKW